MYFLRTTQGITPLLQPLEDSIRQHFLPALTGQNGVSDLERGLLALPGRHGNLGLVNPTIMSEKHTLSLHLMALLTAIITLQRDDTGDSRQQHLKLNVGKTRCMLISSNRQKSLSPLNVQLDGVCIEQACTHKFLGCDGESVTFLEYPHRPGLQQSF